MGKKNFKFRRWMAGEWGWSLNIIKILERNKTKPDNCQLFSDLFPYLKRYFYKAASLL